MLNVSLGNFRYCRRLLHSRRSRIPGDFDHSDYVFVVDYTSSNLSGYDLLYKKATVIELSQGVKKAFAGFNSTGRNEIQWTFKENNLEFSSQVTDWSEFYDFHAICEYERKWIPIPPEELEASLCFYSRFQGKLNSGISCFVDGDVIRVTRIFSRRRSKEFSHLPNKLFSAPTRRNVFEICTWASGQGLRRLDLAGVDMDDEQKRGISRFKLSFGGAVVPVQIGRKSTVAFELFRKKMKAQKIDIF